MSAPTSAGLPRIPELEREFVFVRRLGIGASGFVLLAREKAAGASAPDVAIKLLRPEHRNDDDAAARLVREARMLGNLEHPSILRLHGTRRLAGGHLALVLEFVRGRTVADLLATNGPFPTRDVRRVVQGVGQALDYLDHKRVVHRDLKPGNIHLDEVGGRVLLADFGIARNRDADAGLDATEASHGTPAYMSPEQVDGRVPDGRSDLYALGLVAFEMLAGRPAWGGSSLDAMLARRNPAGVPPVAGVRPGIAPGLGRRLPGGHARPSKPRGRFTRGRDPTGHRPRPGPGHRPVSPDPTGGPVARRRRHARRPGRHHPAVAGGTGRAGFPGDRGARPG